MKCLLLVILLFCVIHSQSQDLRVKYAQDAFYTTGSEIKKGEYLRASQKVIVQPRGRLALYAGKMKFELPAGTYMPDSVLNIHKSRMDKSDSIRTVLKKRN